MATSKLFIPEMVDDKDIIFNKDSNYHKQKNRKRKILFLNTINLKKQGSKN